MTNNEKLLVEALHGLMSLVRYVFMDMGHSGEEETYSAYTDAMEAIQKVESQNKEYE